MTFDPVEIIRKKRDGERLSDDDIAGFVSRFARGETPDYQMAALAMAIYFRGMDAPETSQLTRQMLYSGEVLKGSPGPKRIDKHSTGGVGDKVSLVLAPMLACCSSRVPMISGRGLGATGGTLDKLEAIPGFRTNLSSEELEAVCDRVGCVITGASAQLAPADRKLYALRDVTATVPSIPLITASIMSKKLAAGLDALVLDIKWGSGAFMKRLQDARLLAESLVSVGVQMRLPVAAVISDMNQPLGRMAGHAVEVRESLAALAGDGPDDLMQVTLALGAELLVVAGLARDIQAAKEQLEATIRSGAALAKFHEMARAQGGDPEAKLEIAPAQMVSARRSGYVRAIDGELLGRAITALGGGRRIMTDKIDFAVGLEMLVRLGDEVRVGQPLLRMFARASDAETKVAEARAMFEQAIAIDESPTAPPDLIVDRILGTA